MPYMPQLIMSRGGGCVGLFAALWATVAAVAPKAPAPPQPPVDEAEITRIVMQLTDPLQAQLRELRRTVAQQAERIDALEQSLALASERAPLASGNATDALARAEGLEKRACEEVCSAAAFDVYKDSASEELLEQRQALEAHRSEVAKSLEARTKELVEHQGVLSAHKEEPQKGFAEVKDLLEAHKAAVEEVLGLQRAETFKSLRTHQELLDAHKAAVQEAFEWAEAFASLKLSQESVLQNFTEAQKLIYVHKEDAEEAVAALREEASRNLSEAIGWFVERGSLMHRN